MTLTNEQIDALLCTLNSEAVDVERELGLPLYGVHKENLRNVVSEWFNSLSSEQQVPLVPAQLSLRAHEHVWLPNDNGAAVCACGKHASNWYCEDSPTKLCRYENGDPDQCDICGLPEERA
jgi:uncharacterized protein YgbK (DUF1537 family)